MIKGETIYLTRLDETNAEQAREWLNDPATNEWLLAGQIPISRDAEKEFYASCEKAWADGAAYHMEIHVLEDGRYIGNCGFDSVSLIHRTGEVGIFIGAADDRDRGYGRDAIVTALRFGFDRLGLHRASIKANFENDRAVHLYSSIGFVETGREREAVYMRGRFRDHVCFDMLADEFYARYGRTE